MSGTNAPHDPLEGKIINLAEVLETEKKLSAAAAPKGLRRVFAAVTTPFVLTAKFAAVPFTLPFKLKGNIKSAVELLKAKNAGPVAYVTKEKYAEAVEAFKGDALITGGGNAGKKVGKENIFVEAKSLRDVFNLGARVVPLFSKGKVAKLEEAIIAAPDHRADLEAGKIVPLPLSLPLRFGPKK